MLPLQRYEGKKRFSLAEIELTRREWERRHMGLRLDFVPNKGRKRIAGCGCTDAVSLALVQYPCCCPEVLAYVTPLDLGFYYYKDNHDYEYSAMLCGIDEDFKLLLRSLIGAHYFLMEIVLGYLEINVQTLLLSPLFAVAGCEHSALEITFSCKVIDGRIPQICYTRPMYRNLCVKYCLDNMVFQKLRDQRQLTEAIVRGDIWAKRSMEEAKSRGAGELNYGRMFDGDSFFARSQYAAQVKLVAKCYFRAWEFLFLLCTTPRLLANSLLTKIYSKMAPCFPTLLNDKQRVMAEIVVGQVGAFNNWHRVCRSELGRPSGWCWEEHPEKPRALELQERIGKFPDFYDHWERYVDDDDFVFPTWQRSDLLRRWVNANRDVNKTPSYSPTAHSFSREDAVAADALEAKEEMEAMADQAQGPHDNEDDIFEAQLKMALEISLKEHEQKDPEETETDEEPLLAQSPSLDYPYEQVMEAQEELTDLDEEITEARKELQEARMALRRARRQVIDLTQEDEPRVREAHFLARIGEMSHL